MKNRKFWITLMAGIMAGIMVLSLLLQLIPTKAAAASSSEIKEQINQLEDEQDALQDALDELESKRKENLTEIQEIVDQKSLVDQQVALLHEQIDIMNNQISAYSVLIADKQAELDKAQKQLEELKLKHMERIRAMEEDGELSYWSVLFEANSFTDLLDRLNMIQEIAAADQRRLEEMSEAAQKVADAQQVLQEEKVSLVASREELAIKEAELAVKAEESKSLLSTLLARGEEFEKWMIEKEDELANLEEEINDLEVEYDEAKYQEWLATSVPPTTSGSVPNSTAIYRSGTALTPNVVNGVTWLTPCDYNRISSTFGMRFHPVYHYDKMHNGIDLAIGHTPIYATRAGVVVISGWNDSAGNWAVIDHGDGFRSVYMHMCKRPYVKVGDYVGAGKEIGCVGTTGTSTGNHLHFGISQYNPAKKKYEYVNPLLYIKS